MLETLRKSLSSYSFQNSLQLVFFFSPFSGDIHCLLAFSLLNKQPFLAFTSVKIHSVHFRLISRTYSVWTYFFLYWFTSLIIWFHVFFHVRIIFCSRPILNCPFLADAEKRDLWAEQKLTQSFAHFCVDYVLSNVVFCY